MGLGQSQPGAGGRQQGPLVSRVALLAHQPRGVCNCKSSLPKITEYEHSRFLLAPTSPCQMFGVKDPLYLHLRTSQGWGFRGKEGWLRGP